MPGEDFLPGQPVENPHDRGDDFSRIDPLGAQAQAPGFDPGNVENVADQGQQVFRRAVRGFDRGAILAPLVHALEGQFQHADHRVHRRADFVAHGRQEGTLGPVGFIGLLLGGPQFVEQLSSFADIDPAADDALYFTARITVGENPVIDRQPPATDVQRAIEDQRCAFVHDPLIISLILPGFEGIAHLALHDAFADHVFAFRLENLQITVVTALQQPLAVTHINRVRRAVDQRAHELELIVQRSLGRFALVDLAPHPGIPGHGNQQQKTGSGNDLIEHPVKVVPGFSDAAE